MNKSLLKQQTVLLLVGLLVLGLAACGLNKNSRKWIEKNRVADMYKVYPTENPEDLFKVFPDGFEIEERYVTADKDLYILELEGNAETKVITGRLSQRLDGQNSNHELTVASVKDGKLHFKKQDEAEPWPVNEFLFQEFSLSQVKLSNLI